MNNARQNDNSRGYFMPTERATIPTVSAVGGVFPMATMPQDTAGNPKRQTQVSTERKFANGFLNTQFLPKLRIKENKGKLRKKQIAQKEQSFYASLTYLANYYGFRPPNSEQPYPYNISLAFADAQRQIAQKGKDTSILRELSLMEEDNRLFLSVKERYDTNTTLYYIPIAPLYALLRDKRRRQSAQLLLCVYAYLYQIVDLPYYRDEGRYLGWLYEIMEEWTDEEDEDDRELLELLPQAKFMGDKVEKKLRNPKNLAFWNTHLTHFKGQDNFDEECFELSSQFYEMYRKYPNVHLLIHRAVDEENNDDFEEETCINIDQYVGIVSHTDNVISEYLTSCLNGELAQCTAIEEPTIYKDFTQDNKQFESLDFEVQLFDLLNRLIALVDEYKELNL